MIFPVEVVRITSPYGERKFDKWHYGSDFGAQVSGKDGDYVYAVDDGIIKVSKDNPGGYGEYIVIEHKGICSVYCHLQHRIVSVGTKVKQGEVIGIMGHTPYTRGLSTHLHFEIRNTTYNNGFWDKTTVNGREGVPKYCLDPMPYLLKELEGSEWAEEAWSWATDIKIVDGTRPKDPVTREEVVQMIYNYNRR